MSCDLPLSLGILIDSMYQPKWVADMLRDIIQDRIAILTLVVINDKPDSTALSRTMNQRAKNLFRNRDLLAYEIYKIFDTRRYSPENSPFTIVNIEPIVGTTSTVRVAPISDKYTDRFDDEILAEICRYDLDVALLLGFRILKGGALDIARHGVWSYHHGDNRRHRGGPAGFWEVLLGRPETGAVLQVLTEDLDGGRVLARSRSRTNLISVVRNKVGNYADAVPLVKRELLFLRNEHRVGFEASVGDDTWSCYDGPIYKAPHTRQVLKIAFRVSSRLIRAKLLEVTGHKQWFLLHQIQRDSVDLKENVPDGHIYKYKEIRSPPDRSWADPFPVYYDGKYLLFFEEIIHGESIGHISLLEIGADGKIGQSRRVLSRPHHLSYPLVFEWDKQWYLMPEAGQSRTVELFRATRFPDEWESVGAVLEGVALLDPTIAEIDGQWWLFGAVRLPGSADASALHLYHAPSPLGPWTPHRYNPVKVDVRGARPAGHLFRRDGVWYRPAQDGVPQYGAAIVVHRIEKISLTEFHEETIGRIEPTWLPNLAGTHTINAVQGLSVMDAQRKVFSLLRRCG